MKRTLKDTAVREVTKERARDLLKSVFKMRDIEDSKFKNVEDYAAQFKKCSLYLDDSVAYSSATIAGVAK